MQKKIALMLSMIALSASVAFTGCKTDPASPGSNNNAAVQPKVGTTYTSSETEQGPGGSTTNTVVSTVARTGLTFSGKTNVTMVINSQDGLPRDTTYVHYEANGDVSVYITDLAGGEENADLWSVYPFGSQTTTTLSLTGNFDVNGETVPGEVNIVNKGAGSGTITVAGKTYTTKKVTSSKVASAQGQILDNQTSTVEFAPGIGWIVGNQATGKFGSMQMSLTGFNLK